MSVPPCHRTPITAASLLVASLFAAAGLALSGCTASFHAASVSTSRSSAPSAAPTSTGSGEHHFTIADYIREADLTETPIHQGDASAPRIELPAIDGWVDATSQAPDTTYQAIKYTGEQVQGANYTPNVVVIMSRLSGRSVDGDALLKAAGGEVRNLDGYTPIGTPQTDTVDGYYAYKIAGSYDLDGLPVATGQTTVVIPGTASAFVVQISATANKEQLDILKDVVGRLDKGLRIHV